MTDGVVSLRAPTIGDRSVLVAGRDAVFRRFLGDGSPDPNPMAVVEVEDEVVGWVDYDLDRDWLQPGEVNVGYAVFAAHRGMGYGTRAVQLLAHHLSQETDHTLMSLFVNRDNHASQALARRVGCGDPVDFDGHPYFTRPVPPRTYTDGVVTIRRMEVTDLDRDLDAKDDAQIDWMWMPGERESWQAMSTEERREHALAGLVERRDAFGTGPKWVFVVDGPHDEPYVAYVDCDLANDGVPWGEANISYSAHPAFRGRGHVSRAVRLARCFLAENTGAREAHIKVDAENEASLRVARAVGAVEIERWTNELGRVMVRHVLPVESSAGPGR